MGKIYRYWGPEEGDKEPLHRLPRKSLLRVNTDKGWKTGVFHGIDGMYSKCTLDDYPGEPGKSQPMFHLKAWTPMVYVDGRWQIDEDDNE